MSIPLGYFGATFTNSSLSGVPGPAEQTSPGSLLEFTFSGLTPHLLHWVLLCDARWDVATEELQEKLRKTRSLYPQILEAESRPFRATGGYTSDVRRWEDQGRGEILIGFLSKRQDRAE